MKEKKIKEKKIKEKKIKVSNTKKLKNYLNQNTFLGITLAGTMVLVMVYVFVFWIIRKRQRSLMHRMRN